jgi:hypothetical protein
MKGLMMTKQSTLKYNWIIHTLYTSKEKDIQIDAETIKAVFNIPLSDARFILTNFNKGYSHD